MTSLDPVDARAEARQKNEALVRGLLHPLLEPGPRGVAMVQHLQADDVEAAVYFDLVTSGGTVRVEVANRDASKEALVHTRSLSVLHQNDTGGGALAPVLENALRRLGQLFERRDVGGLSLVRPGGRRTGRHPLLVYSAHEARQHTWSREKFDQELAGVAASATGPIEMLIAVVSQPCEMQCVFCPSVDRDKARTDWAEKGDREQLADLLYQLERSRVLGVDTVDLGGNDVLRFGLIHELLAGISALGYRKIVIQTTGLPLSDRAFADAIARGPAVEVCIPIYGTTAEVHDSITQTPGSFARICGAIDHARELGAPRVRLHTIALGSTLSKLEGLIEFCTERFGLSLRVSPLRPNWVAEREHLSDAPRFTDLRPIIARYPSHFAGEFPLCQLPVDLVLESPTLREEGASTRNRINLFDLGMSGKEHARVRFERHSHHAAPCEACSLRLACPGVNGAYLESHGADELTPFTEHV